MKLSKVKVNNQEAKKLFWTINIVIILLLLIIIITISLLFWKSSFSAFFGLMATSGQIFFGLSSLFFIWYISLGGAKAVNLNEIALVTLFGNPLFTYKPGYGLILFILPGIYKFEKETNLIIPQQFPEELREINKNNDEEIIPEKNLLPNVIATATPETAIYEKGEKEKYKNDTLHKHRLVLPPNYIVYFQIVNIIHLYQNVGSLSKVKKLIQSASESALTVEFGKKTTAMIIGSIEKIDESLKKHLQQTASKLRWGIKIYGFLLLPPNLPKELNEAIIGVPLAATEKQTIIIESEAQAEKIKILAFAKNIELMKEGEGLAFARQVYLEAEAFGYNKIAKALGLPMVELIKKLEVVESMFKGSEKTILTNTGALNEALGLLPLIKQTMISNG